jgi:hypothetical protein
MQNLNLLEDVLETIAEDENLLRIKRLIVFACHGFWVEDQEDLQAMELRTLIEELLAAIPDVDTLKHMLNSSVKKLSKPEVYTVVAELIVDSIGMLYTKSPRQVFPDLVPQSIQPEKILKNLILEQNGLTTEINSIEYATDDSTAIERKTERLVGRKFEEIPNLFDLKLEVSNSIAPLRAKILVFSILHYQFDPRDRSWRDLYTHDLGELLQNLYQFCGTIEKLDESLRHTANQLGGDQEYLQAAGTIANYMKPLYFS